jgi:hypothetical protein
MRRRMRQRQVGQPLRHQQQGRLCTVAVYAAALSLFLWHCRSTFSHFRDLATPLIRANASGSPAEVEELLRQGANVDSVADTGLTALHIACQVGHSDTADMLLRYSANASHEGVQGLTALDYASEQGHAETLELLIQRRATRHIIIQGPLVGGWAFTWFWGRY